MSKDETINILAEPVRELVCPACECAIDVTGKTILTAIKCPDCGAELTVPARLGDFILIEVLGSGGMATVYKAYDKSLGRYVAVKIMRRQYGEDPKFVERFLREARAAARINHPNVVQIYSCGEKKRQPYIVMEYVDGGKFEKMIEENAPLNENRVLEIGRDVADGLRAASDIGLVHGDIKPANIVFDRNGMAKVADFGLAHFATEEEDRSEVWGTPYYIAPERARKEGQDHRSDIYCLGATLYHALSGEPPFDGETAVDVVMARLEGDAPDLSDVRDDVSPATSKLVARMLERERVKRYPNYNSLLSDFDRAIKKFAEYKRSSARSDSSNKSKKRNKASPKKKTKSSGGKKVWIFVLLFLMLAAIGGFLLWSESPDDADGQRKPQTADVREWKPARLQPFSVGQDSRLASILRDLTPESTLATKNALVQLTRTLSKKNVGREWINLFHATIEAMKRDIPKRNKYLESIPAKDRDYGFNAEATRLPERIGDYIKGKIDSPAEPAGEDWPKWYSDLSLFFVGLSNLLDGNFDKASESFQEYVEVERPEEPTWPYSLQDLAKNLDLRIAKWKQFDKKVDNLAASGKHENAIDILDRVKSDIFVHFKKQKIDIIRKKQKAIEAEARKKAEAERKAREAKAAAKKREEEKRHKAAVDADMKAVQQWEDTIRQLLAGNEFKEALKAANKFDNTLNTEEGKKKLEEQVANIRRLFDLKDFLVDSINRNPYSGGAKILKGKAVASSLKNITVELAGGVGTSEYAWSRVEPELLIPMARFYLQRSQLKNKAKAEIMNSLVEYSKLHSLGMEDNFEKIAEKLGASGEG